MNLKDLGVIIIEDFISVEEETLLETLVDLYPGKDRDTKSKPNRMIRFGEFKMTEGLIDDPKGKSQGYGGTRRSYGLMNDGFDSATVNIPPILKTLSDRLKAFKVQSVDTNVFVINRYLPGTRISRHIDHDDNGPVIPVIGFKSDSDMILSLDNERLVIPFPRRSLVALTGESRYTWFHETLPTNQLRYSLVFRNLQK
jgi:alkylated DNA repair dioxygenase AlkB